MKIGVITYWYGNSNYGMMLQCWALQTYLKDHGHDPFVIRFKKNEYVSVGKKILTRIGLLSLINRVKCIIKNIPFVDTSKNDALRKFEEFRRNNISLSDQSYSTIAELRNEPPLADCYITGSDQVWSQLLDDENNYAYFLDFGYPSTKRVAYAPSFSLKEYPAHLKNKLSRLLQEIDFISAREYDGVRICNELGFKALKVLDPTLLLERSKYTQLCQLEPRHTLPYVYIYSLNIKSAEEVRWSELHTMSKLHSLKTIVTPSDGYLKGGEIFGNDVEYEYATIEQWLSLIRDAEMTVTSSFHGIVMSIILERPFVYVPLQGSFSVGNNRVLDLLQELKLEDRILTGDVCYEDLYAKRIEWNNVKERLSVYKKESIEYLNKSLEA